MMDAAALGDLILGDRNAAAAAAAGAVK